MRICLGPHYSGVWTGPEFTYDEEEVAEILEANGFKSLNHEEVGPCGLTDYYRDEWTVRGPDGNPTDARRALSGIIKDRFKALLMAPAEK